MRVNVYAEEMTDKVEVIGKEIEGQTFTGLRFYLELPVTTGDGNQVQGPFIHRPGDDDSSAVTFWGKSDLRKVLDKALHKLDAHYGVAKPRTFHVDQIAHVAHEINRAYCQALGDDSQPPWETAPLWQRESAIEGVKMHIEHPNAGPAASHINWMDQKIAAGWKYGPVKDPEKKEHPCMVSWEELPREQQVKDYLFRAVVHILAHNGL